MAGSSDAQDFVAQIAALTAKMRENEEKFERLEAENTAIRDENAELLVRVETLSADTKPPAEVPCARFRVLVNPMQPLEEETTLIASNAHQAQATYPPMTIPGMSSHFVSQQSTTTVVSQTQRIDTRGQT